MDGRRILMQHPACGSLAICTLDESGTPTTWLPLRLSVEKQIPVALDDRVLFLQNKINGALERVLFDAQGRPLSAQRLWTDARGWIVRGTDANRLLLEHETTGDVAIWAANPKTPLFRPYFSFILQPGWEARDFDGDYILIRQTQTGETQIVELGDGYEPRRFTRLENALADWQNIALSQ